MADIDLKTETPDTSLPTTGFLFGADSQAASAPSVYSTQTVATTLLGSTSLTGATITADAPVLNLSQTWNASGVTFTGLRFNAAGSSDANSAAASLLMDLQVGGSSRFKVDKAGTVTVSAGSSTAGAQSITFSGNTNVGFYAGSQQLYITGNAVNFSSQIICSNNVNANTDSAAFRLGASYDVILTRRAAANLRLGAADAAGSAISISSVASQQITLASNHGLSNGAAVQVTFTAGGAVPAGTAVNTTYYARSISAAVLELYGTYDQALNTASTTGRVNVTSAGTTAFINRAAPFQTLSVQSFTGTDIPGQPFVITGSQGTGTGRGGDIIFQVAPAGTTGTAQNALSTALTINSARQIVSAIAGTAAAPAFCFNNSAGTWGTGFYSTGNGFGFGIPNGTPVCEIEYNTGVKVLRDMYIGWSDNSLSSLATIDTRLFRDAANTLALRNGTNAQTFNVYNTFTSSTNFERFRIVAQSAAAVLIGTEKGSGGGTARALALQTDGTTRLTIETNGDLTIADAENIILGTTTGTKIGTSTSQKIGFFNKAPVVQPTAVADATDAATVITQLNALLSRMRDLGLIAT